MTIAGIIQINFPGSPPILTKGEKAAIVVVDEASTGNQTSFTPLFADSIAVNPFSIYELIESEITIASSTNIPTTRINPPKTNIFNELFAKYKKIIHPIIEKGIPKAVQKAVLISNVRKRTTFTKKNPKRAFPRTRLILFLVNLELSFNFVMVIFLGNFLASK